jgi:NAD(P)-dependent dehydrogenase (short-subunit alcohol dehydrogenase family)
MAGEALSRFDGVVNIPAVETPAILLCKVLDVNVVGAFMVARAAVARHAQHGRGSNVNISSMVGLSRRQEVLGPWRFQGSGDRVSAGAGQRPRPPWHPRQCGGAGPGGNAHDGR